MRLDRKDRDHEVIGKPGMVIDESPMRGFFAAEIADQRHAPDA